MGSPSASQLAYVQFPALLGWKGEGLPWDVLHGQKDVNGAHLFHIIFHCVSY